MKTLLFLSILFSTSLWADPVVPIYNYDQSNATIPNGGIYSPTGGFGGGIGSGVPGLGYSGNAGYPSQGQTSGGIAISNSGVNSYNIVKSNANCPLLTATAKDDQDTFGDLQNYFRAISQKSECAQNNLMGFNGPQQQISQLESMLKASNSNGAKCYSKNVNMISNRNMAYYYVEKDMDISSMSPYYSCNASVLAAQALQKGIYPAPTVTKDEIKECIKKKYESSVEENVAVCKEVVAPQIVQEEIDRGMVELERILVQTLTQPGPCAPKTQDTFKMVINTFLKTKALSAVGPWGSVAGFGADIIGSLLDKFFPSDAQKASALMGDILSEDNYEQNACLYLTIQQKMYCEDNPIKTEVPLLACQEMDVNKDVLKLIDSLKDLRKIAGTLSTTPPLPQGYANFASPSAEQVDYSKFEMNLDDFTKYAKASEPDIRARLKTLPKVQQAKELAKINQLYAMLDSYQNLDPANPESFSKGQMILTSLAELLLSTNKDKKIDFEDLILKTTPGLNTESIKLKGIANSIETMMASNSISSFSGSEEKSRSLAKYNKYKNAMGEMAQAQFKDRLDKQFTELKKQVLFVAKQENGIVNDSVSEGLLRNIVRHCVLLQEIYDPKLEGRIPEQCAKLNCGSENRFEWFSPKENSNNFTRYKNSYCSKNFSYSKVENRFISELKNKNGATICGKKVSDFFF